MNAFMATKNTKNAKKKRETHPIYVLFVFSVAIPAGGADWLRQETGQIPVCKTGLSQCPILAGGFNRWAMAASQSSRPQRSARSPVAGDTASPRSHW